jgi:membrane protease YdiL (CAAX protease family)
MSLQQPLIAQGWIRAILLFVIYLALTISVGFLVSSLDAWLSISFIISLATVYIFRKFVDRKPFNTIGLDLAGLFPHSLIGLSFGTLLVTCGTLLIFFLNGIDWIDIDPNFQNATYGLGILIMVAISEELVFRGYVLRNLMKSMNRWLAVVISAALFTAVHLSNPSVPFLALLNTFLGGLVIGITFMYTRNLWLPIFFHFSWNFVQGPLLGYPVSGIPFRSVLIMQPGGDELISGGGYGFEASLMCSVVLILAFLLWVVLHEKKEKVINH